MKILTAAVAPVPLDSDFCDAVAGEICIPHAIVCTSPGRAAECGCDQTHLGISSHARTTTVRVSETEWTLEQLVAVCRECLIETNWVEVFGADGVDEVAEDQITLSVSVAQDHPLGMILRPRFNHATEQWFYAEVDDGA